MIETIASTSYGSYLDMLMYVTRLNLLIHIESTPTIPIVVLQCQRNHGHNHTI